MHVTRGAGENVPISVLDDNFLNQTGRLDIQGGTTWPNPGIYACVEQMLRPQWDEYVSIFDTPPPAKVVLLGTVKIEAYEGLSDVGHDIPSGACRMVHFWRGSLPSVSVSCLLICQSHSRRPTTVSARTRPPPSGSSSIEILKSDDAVLSIMGRGSFIWQACSILRTEFFMVSSINALSDSFWRLMKCRRLAGVRTSRATANRTKRLQCSGDIRSSSTTLRIASSAGLSNSLSSQRSNSSVSSCPTRYVYKCWWKAIPLRDCFFQNGILSLGTSSR